jgi:uncharacterized iron-regulated membrane protein
MQRRVRDLWFEIHKYAGLATFLFLSIAGLTGCALVFRAGLDEALNPDLYRVAPGPVLPAAELARRLERDHPTVQVTRLPLTERPGHATVVTVAGRDGARLAFDQVFLDPASGRVIGAREDKAGWGRRGLMHGVYDLHSGLIAGAPGRWLMGIVAAAWLLSNLVGLYLTLPSRGPFWRKWWALWTVNPRAKLPRLLLDLHRASGLWLLPVLTILALTSFCLNFYSEVTEPIAQALSPARPSPFDAKPSTPHASRMDWARAVDRGTADAARRAPDLRPVDLLYVPEHGLFGVRLTRSGKDDYAGLGPVALYYRESDGQFVFRDDPGRDSAGRAVLRSLYPIHTGEVFGWTTRLLVFVLGLATLEMGVTGTYLWLKRRGARNAAAKARLK